MPSLYVTRGINFYFVLVVSLAVVVLNHLYVRRRKGGGASYELLCKNDKE